MYNIISYKSGQKYQKNFTSKKAPVHHFRSLPQKAMCDRKESEHEHGAATVPEYFAPEFGSGIASVASIRFCFQILQERIFLILLLNHRRQNS